MHQLKSKRTLDRHDPNRQRTGPALPQPEPAAKIKWVSVLSEQKDVILKRKRHPFLFAHCF